MKKFLFRTTLVIALLFAGWSVEAANPTKIAEAVKQIVAEFDGVRYTIIGTIRDESDKAEYLQVQMSDKGADYTWVYIKK